MCYIIEYCLVSYILTHKVLTTPADIFDVPIFPLVKYVFTWEIKFSRKTKACSLFFMEKNVISVSLLGENK